MFTPNQTTFKKYQYVEILCVITEYAFIHIHVKNDGQVSQKVGCEVRKTVFAA